MKRALMLAGLALGLLAYPVDAQTTAAAPKAEARAPAKPAAKIDISGQWQGVFVEGPKLRTILKISKAPGGGYKADLYSIDQNRQPFPVDSITLTGSTMKYAITRLGGSYEGQLQSDGQSIKGKWTQGGHVDTLDIVRVTKETAWAIDPSPHKIQFVTTTDKVKLEVLDWGGTGRTVVFIPGLGADAHVFDKFTAKLTPKYHVYGVTRRGYGDSDKPDPATGASYMADRMGDDVLEAMAALKIDKPVLAGWSLGGEEMSSIATRHPDKVAGLVYLDAGYAYSFYAPGNAVPIGSNLLIDSSDLRAKIARAVEASTPPAEASALVEKLLAVDLPQLKADLETQREVLKAQPADRPAPPPRPDTLENRIGMAIMAGEQKYTDLKVPVLALFAFPHAPPPNLPEAQRASFERQEAVTDTQIKAFETGNPTAKVLRIANAQHAIFLSNPDDVQREMTAFIDGLK